MSEIEGDRTHQIRAIKRAIAVKNARVNFLAFVRFMMPHPEDQEDPDRSRFITMPYHALVGEALERVARAECLRMALAVPPQHGKSQLASRMFPAWYAGLFPHRDIIFGTYNQDFAEEFGAEVREIMTSPEYAMVFPEAKFKSGSKAKDYMKLTAGGRLSFIGRGSSGTGKSADLVVIDDPLKNADEAESVATRKQLHEWYSKVIYSRVRVTTAVIVIQTRWHEDDLIGRLCDTDHPERGRDKKGEVLKDDPCWDWTYVNIPAVLKKGAIADALGVELARPTLPRVISQFGSEPMAALWPERFPLEHLATAAKLNPVGFNALYMGRPTPEDGDYFKATWIDGLEYDAHQLPTNLRIYCASDHALSEERKADFTVLGCVGVDEHDDIWVLPDVVWERMETDRTVEELLSQFRTRKPLLWWMEGDIISKGFGPFLRKRMLETKTYCTIDVVTPSRDKRVRARNIQGRMSMRKVHLPRFAPWYREARAQLLKFPFGTKDDFVDFLAHIGQGLDREVPAQAETSKDNVVRVGSIEWVKRSSDLNKRKERLRKAVAGW
jgi:predicted phage terminase large subunit-like protein